MDVYYSEKHHGKNSNPVSFYNYNAVGIENTSEVHIATKYSILRIFPKVQLE